MSTAQLLAELKQADQDFEWYPTTDEIIATVSRDIIKRVRGIDRYSNVKPSMLDVGAGDGRVLQRVQSCVDRATNITMQLFAMEKANVHLNNLPKEIVIVGTDFTEQTLIDKSMWFIFSNPPYSEFEEWAVKLIREAACSHLYLVVPRRWKESVEIKQAIKLRSAEVETLGTFDFENAERQARAVVDVLRVSFTKSGCAFDTAIESMFPELEHFDKLDNEPGIPSDDKQPCEVIDGSGNLTEVLVRAYDAEVAQLIETYRNAVKINPALLAELGVSKQGILTGLRNKIEGLKEKYWKTLFDRFKPITKRLATKQRTAFLDSLKGKAVIDFTESNILAMLIWVTKWSNDHFDTQLVDLFKSLSEFCNVVNYKSNDRVWKKGDWRYYELKRGSEEAAEFTRYKLEYRIVLEHAGGIHVGHNYNWDNRKGLQQRAFEYLQDVITVANNLGFDCNDTPDNYEWKSNKQNTFKLSDGKPLVAVRAFKNGNLHMHFNPRVMLAINVEAGRLLGWLRDPEQAATELKATPEEKQIIAHVFNSSYRLAHDKILRIGQQAVAPTTQWIEYCISGDRVAQELLMEAITHRKPVSPRIFMCTQDEIDVYKLLSNAGFQTWSTGEGSVFNPEFNFGQAMDIASAVKFLKSDEYQVQKFLLEAGAA